MDPSEHLGQFNRRLQSKSHRLARANYKQVLSLQQDGRVLAIAVTPGEAVRAGERLLDFGASAAAVSTYQQAVNALTAARQQRAHTAQLLVSNW